MSRIEKITPIYVDLIPKTLERGIVYVSRKYKTASHLCCCGCGNKVVTPLKPGGWQLTDQRGVISLNPSIGSWSLPCQSHYFIRGNKIVWSPKWSESEIEAGRRNDQLAREQHFDAQSTQESLGQKILKWFSRLFGG